MKEHTPIESSVSDMGASLGAQARDLLKAQHAGPNLTLHRQLAAPLPAATPAQPPAKQGLLAKAASALSDLLKANVKGYTKSDGTVVKPYVSKVQKHAGSIESHPNYHPDDHAALKGKGYDDKEISAIWDADTARNGGQPSGGNSRKDLKLPTQAKPDGQPGPAADAREKAKAAYAPLRKDAGEKGQAALDAHAAAAESNDPEKLKGAIDAVAAGKAAHEAAGKAARAIPYPGSSSPWEHHDERASSLGKLHAELSAKHKAASKPAGKKALSPAEAQAKAKEFAAAQKPGSKPYGTVGQKPAAGSMASEAANAGAPAPEKPTAGDVDPDHLDLMASSLANDEDSSDDELHEHFTGQGVPEEHSKAAIAARGDFQTADIAEQTGDGLRGMMKKGAAKAADMKVLNDGVAQEHTEKAAEHEKAAAAATDPGMKSAHTRAMNLHKKAAGKASAPDSKAASKAANDFSEQVKSGAAKGGPGHGALGGDGIPPKAAKPAAGSMASEAANAGAPAPEKPAAAAPAAPAAAGPVGEAPPHADSNIDGWDQLPDAENPKHALSGMGSGSLGRLATMKPEHAKAYAHKELANRGLDSDGGWKGFEGANAHHAANIPSDFVPEDVHGADPGISGHMQTVNGKVLQAAAKGHLNLQDRARATLASRGHDVKGNWIGFDKAAEKHGFDGKTGKKVAAKPGAGPQQDLFKALPAGHRPMFFVSADRSSELEALVARKEA